MRCGQSGLWSERGDLEVVEGYRGLPAGEAEVIVPLALERGWVFVAQEGLAVDLPLDAGDYRVVEAIATDAVERAIMRGVTQATSLGGYPAASGRKARKA